MVRTGELLEESGCKVSILNWKAHEGKGIDDLILNQGGDRFNEVLQHASPLQWEADKHYRNEYLKLRGYVLKTYGEGRNPTELMIDSAIAYIAKAQDAFKIVGRGNTVREAIKKGTVEDAKTHLLEVKAQLKILEDKLKPALNVKQRISL